MSLPVDKPEVPLPFSWPEEMRVLRRFGLEDGVRVLDLGTGPGVVARELLRQWTNIAVIGVDRNLDALVRARSAMGLLAERFSGLAATVEHLPFRSQTFDFATARLLLQYLPAPIPTVREILRTLRPEGRVVVTDVDRTLAYAVTPPLPELDSLMERYDEWHRSRGGDRGVGARLKDILREAGAEHVALETVRFESRPETAAVFLDTLMGPLRLTNLHEAGRVSSEEVAGFLAARDRWLTAPDRGVGRYLRMACGAKPG